MLGEIYRVSMIGHRIVEDFDIEEKLYDLFCDMLRTKEYVEFYLGRNGDFDIMAASVIKRLKKNFRDDNSVMILVLPYPVKDYEDYEKYYDEIVIPKELYGVHPKAAITERNRWMVTNLYTQRKRRNSRLCAYGGAARTGNYKNIKAGSNEPAERPFLSQS